jgi:pyruvate formate lyase activating enzyme
MRQNIKGELFTHAYGGVIANNVDPIEKKPMYHVLPGTYSYSIATTGCNFRCSFCQNWSISQVSARERCVDFLQMSPEEVVKEAKRSNCASISYTYTEPTVFFEYAMDIAALAKKENIRNIFVTNGFMTKEAIDIAAGYIDAANVDLKAFSADFYKNICGGRLEPVLESIEYMREKGIWIEITTLMVPGQNDSDEEIEAIVKYVAGIDPSIPWHISRFHPDYRYTESEPTPTGTIQRALEKGRKHGLKYIYPGNIAAAADTLCPRCGESLIKRAGFYIKKTSSFHPAGKCICCGETIEGIWK